MGLGLVGNSAEKKNLHDFRSIEPYRIAHSILQLTQFQLYIKDLYFE